MPEQLKNKLFNYEVPPPPGAWKEVATELVNTNEFLPLSRKMYDFEVTPPAAAWKSIASLLDNHDETINETPVKSIPRRVNHIMAAAAIFGILLMGSLYILYNNSSRRQMSDVQKNLKNLTNGDQKNKQTEPIAPSPNTNLPKLDYKQNPAVASLASDFITRKEKKNYSRGNNKSLRNTIVNIAHSLIEPTITIAAKPIRNEKGDIIQDMRLVNVTENKYISVTGPNGQQTKISAKFMNLLLYLNGDSDIEEFDGYFDKNFLESLIWKSRFEDWRKKIIETTFSPSSTNFMDILEFKDLIMKDKEN